MNSESIQELASTFDAHAQQTEGGIEYWLARDLQALLGYKRWQNFDHLIKRANHILIHKHLPGHIEPTSRTACIGSGATREITDYLIDRPALNIVMELAASYKLTNSFSIRSESVVMQLLEKYCLAKNICFTFQHHLGGFVFDCMIGNQVLVEFDEPHHQECKRQAERDSEKDRLAESEGLKILRINLESDIIDLILAIQKWEPDMLRASESARIPT
jgi:very-short-patch-repair endonuclease